MKTDLFIESMGKQTDYRNLIDMAKECWKDDGHLVKDISTLTLYFKPEENACYYVINNDTKGHFEV